jgi:alpha-ketoglutarate-dependent taurine dioxygenase
LLRSHLLLVLRNQESPSHAELDRFFAHFGRLVLDTESGRFHYNTFSSSKSEYVYRAQDGNYVVNTETGAPELVWHNDMSHRPETKTIAVLEAISCEPMAEPTDFRNMYVAYELLPAGLRASLARRQGVFIDPRRDLESNPRLCDAMHPVLLHHPDSDRVALYVNDHTKRIVGLDEAESRE